MSFLNFWMPMFLSTCHGGIWRVETRSRIDFAHGRASSNVMSDIGAIDPGSWHDWHLAWKIGATSFENVTFFAWSADRAVPAGRGNAETAAAPIPQRSFTATIIGSFPTVDGDRGTRGTPPKRTHRLQDRILAEP